MKRKLGWFWEFYIMYIVLRIFCFMRKLKAKKPQLKLPLLLYTVMLFDALNRHNDKRPHKTRRVKPLMYIIL